MAQLQYVVQTHPCEEKLAIAELTQAGFWTCWLASKERYRAKYGWRELEVSTFPSYLFVGFDVADERWRIIPQKRGVKRILGSDPTHPTPLPIGAVDRLRSRFDAGEFKAPTAIPLAINDYLIVEAGPFAGRVGICTMSRGERIKILMEILGDEREIEIWSGMVKRVPMMERAAL